MVGQRIKSGGGGWRRKKKQTSGMEEEVASKAGVQENSRYGDQEGRALTLWG